MFRSVNKYIIALATTAVLATGCGQKYSKDDVQPAQYSPSVIVGTDAKSLYALNPSNGLKNWEVAFVNSVLACPLVYRGFVYVGTANNLSGTAACDTIYKINSKTGKFVKKVSLTGGTTTSVRATPLSDAEFIYVGATNDTLYALDTGTLVAKWKFDAGSSIVSSPTIYDKYIYFASVGGVVYCLDKTTGALVWSYTAGAGSGFSSSGAASFPYFYIGSVDSNMYAFYLVSPGAPAGTLKWKYKTGGAIYSSPAASAGKVVFGSTDFKVYCLDSITGNPNWTKTTLSNVYSSPVVTSDNNLVLIGSNDGNLYALNMNDGSRQWAYNTLGAIAASPTIYNGIAYIGSGSKYLWAINVATGTLLWRQNMNATMQSSPAIEDYSRKQYNSQVSGHTNWY